MGTFMYFNGKGQKIAEAIVTRIRRSGMQVNIPRYGIEGVVSMPEEDWVMDEEKQCIVSRKNTGSKIVVFDHVMVNIEADSSDFRNRTFLRFERIVDLTEREAFKEAEETRRTVEKEMFPDR